MEYSPIAFFAFNRPYHTYETLNSLSKNSEAKNTDLYAFIDGHRKTSEIHLIDSVEKIINSFSNKFKTITINRAKFNLSCSPNIKRGISEVLSKYETVITLEDDIVVSKYFLSYMNNALVIYKNQTEVWHINGYNFPTKIDSKLECFFIRTMFCWGWATWKDRWNKFIDDPLSCDPYYLSNVFNARMIKDFDLNLRKSLFWSQVLNNANGKLNNIWDIFWYSFIFLNKGLCLTPSVSLTRNIGHDGSGIHSSYENDILTSEVNEKNIKHFPKNIIEDTNCINQIRSYLNKKNNIFLRLKRKIFILLNYLKKT